MISFDSITKTFGGTTALDNVSFSLERARVHALMGENGAGKTTLAKVLAGIHRPDRGRMVIDGETVRFATPRDARHAGIGMVHQELAFCPDLSVAENLCLGRYPTKTRVFLSRTAMAEKAREMLRDIGADVDPRTPMRDLPVARQQVVQIAAAVGTGADILVFDEPTSALSEGETRHLFDLIGRLKAGGVTILYVSHRMAEVFDLCDSITVLRDGRFVGSLQRSDADQDTVIRMMIGRELEAYFPRHAAAPAAQQLLEIDSLSSPGRFEGVSFSVRAGEIVGFAGLVGSGRSEVAAAVLGLDRQATGSVVLDGNELMGQSLRRRIAAGLGLVPEDRKRQGLALGLSCRINFSLTQLDRLRRFLFIDRKREREMLRSAFADLSIRASGYDAPASSLSGGNQQKIVLAKWLSRSSRVLILDEPTRGVDVGAKAAIHALIDALAQRGMGIVLISSELPELLHLSTRILVMRGGRIVGELPREESTQDRLLRMMAGIE